MPAFATVLAAAMAEPLGPVRRSFRYVGDSSRPTDLDPDAMVYWGSCDFEGDIKMHSCMASESEEHSSVDLTAGAARARARAWQHEMQLEETTGHYSHDY